MTSQTVNAADSGTWMLGDRTVNRLGFGTMRLPQTGEAFSPTAPPRDRDQAIAVLRRAVELGVNHLDTAAFYFSSLRSANELVNRALVQRAATGCRPPWSAHGALVATLARAGTVRLQGRVEDGTLALLLFMAATMAMGVALSDSGAAAWLVGWIPLAGRYAARGCSSPEWGSSHGRPSGAPVPLRPVLRAGAAGGGGGGRGRGQSGHGGAGVHGRRRFLPHPAVLGQPVALFADVPDTPTYTPRDLLRLSAFLAPLTAALVLLFALAVWPLLGVPVLLETQP
ncbi:hypothetical protein SCALM49S_05040 [Streptomyces californicus]